MPEDAASFSRADYLAAGLAWLAAMAVYVRTLPPTVTGEDSGELITAAYTMGIAHPPGYPLWCMLGKLFTLIVPFGSIGWRVSFMSAFLGAATVLVVCLFVLKLTRNRVAAVAAAVALAFSSEFWEQSILAEVYSLNALTIVLSMFLLLLWYERRRDYLLFLFALVYGLGLCNHHTVHFMGPVFGLYVLSVDHQPWRRWQTYLTMGAIAGVTWLLVHLYLPIRSMADPPVDWGNPQTWENFWDVVMRRQYSFGFKKNPLTITRFAGQAWTFLKLYSREFTPWLAALPLLGLYPLWKRSRRHFALVIGSFFYIVLGFIFVLNFDLDKESIWVNNVFWVPAYMMAAILIGPAVAWIGSLKAHGLRLSPLAAILLAVIGVLPVWSNFHHNDKSEYYFAHDYAMNIFKTLEEDAIYFPVADHSTFPLMYLQAIEGYRPDVIIANKYGYPEESVYEGMPVELRTGIPKIPSQQQEALIEDWVVANSGRPVYFTKKRPIQGVPGMEMVNVGLVYRAALPGWKPPEENYWDTYTWHTLDQDDTRGEYSAEIIVSDYHFYLGRHLLQHGEVEKGLEELAAALRVSGDSRETLNNIGSACAEYGQLDAAKEYYLRALDIDSDYLLSLQNLARVYLQAGEADKALRVFRRVVELEPGDLEARWHLAHCLSQAGQHDEALEMFQQLAEMTPEDPKVFREMGFILLNHKGQPDLARRMFSISLRLDPNQADLMAYMAPTPERTPFDAGIPGMDLPIPELPIPQIPQAPEIPGAPPAQHGPHRIQREGE